MPSDKNKDKQKQTGKKAQYFREKKGQRGAAKKQLVSPEIEEIPPKKKK